jgi:hypothetical protein
MTRIEFAPTILRQYALLADGERGGLVVDGLVVAQHDTGSLLGYDRRPQQGPALIRAIVAYLHRRAGYVTWGGVHTVDWDERRVLLSVETLEKLEAP